MMNDRGKAIGLTHSHFVNPHGLPDPAEYVTMRDMARLAAHLIRTYPDRYPVFSEAEFTYNKVRQHNRNPALAEVQGADGLKTGHTEESGYSLVASAQREGRRLILAMSGLKSSRDRAQEARKLLDYGFRGFEAATVAKAGAPVGNAPVSGGATNVVPLVPREPVTVVVAKSEGIDHVAQKIVVDRPAAAPVKEGDRIATLRVVRRDGDREAVLREVPLYAGASVERGTIVQRAWETTTDFVMQQWQTILGVVQNGTSVSTASPADHPAERQT
jgi:serine-type D-Ala-D-Ala carboxypeptidase (penicillin-binding protein 5/6)